MKKPAAALTLSVAALTLGCYTYQPIDVGDLQPQMDVRARVTGQQADELADVLMDDDRTIEGTVLQNGGDEVLIEVSTGTAERRGRLESLNQRVRIPADQIQTVDLKERDQGRTLLVIGGLVAVTGLAVILAISNTSTNSSNPPGPGGPEDSVVPLLRIPVGR